MRSHSVLEQLRGAPLAERTAATTSPTAWRNILSRQHEVAQVRDALRSGAVDRGDVEEFATSLVLEFRRDARFPGEATLAALAVALEDFFAPFAGEFLGELARLRLSEMPIAIRVARLCVEDRARRTTDARPKLVAGSAPIAWTTGAVTLPGDGERTWTQTDLLVDLVRLVGTV